MKVLRLGDVWSERPKPECARRLRGHLPTGNGIAERAGIMRTKHTQKVMGLSKANHFKDQTACLFLSWATPQRVHPSSANTSTRLAAVTTNTGNRLDTKVVHNPPFRNGCGTAHPYLDTQNDLYSPRTVGPSQRPLLVGISC